ncbi:MAG: hypothetical protein GQ565_05370 [Candidatus Aegiribacteria sp.]|nr:hypothetical protein [Candidatus Aegiribacteria sp.]
MESSTGMKLFNIDWEVIVRLAAIWNGLRDEERWSFSNILHHGSSSFYKGNLKSDAGVLIRVGLLKRVEKNPDMLRLTPDGDILRRMLKDLDKIESPLGDAGAPESMTEYVHELLSMRERKELLNSPDGRMKSWEVSRQLAGQSVSPAWVKSFLKAENSQDWRNGAVSQEEHPLFPGGDTFAIVQKIVCELDTAGGTLKLDELVNKLGDCTRGMPAAALRKAIGVLLIFMKLDMALRLCVGILPGIYKKLHWTPPEFPDDFSQESMKVCTQVLEDMTVILVEATSVPIQTRKNDGAIFSRTMDHLSEALQPMDSMFARIVIDDRENRVRYTRNILLRTGYLEEADSEEGRHILRTTDRGREWVVLRRRERLRAVLQWINDFMNKRKMPSSGYSNNRVYLGGFPDYSPYVFKGYYKTLDVRSEILKAFSILDERDCVWVGQLFEYLSHDDNPLLSYMEQNNAALYRPDGYYMGVTMSDDEVVEEWVSSLKQFFFNVLMPLGCISCMVSEEGRIAVRLTEAGRFLTGLRDDFNMVSDEKADIVIQPDFSVVFMSPSPGAEAVIAPLAERTGRGAGEIFRINAEKVIKAAVSGITSERILSDLENLSDRKLPENVRHQIEEWCGRCRRIQKKSVVLIRCPDAETALRVKSAGKSKVEQLTDTILAVSDRRNMKTLTRILREEGITFE